jgi:hypothetical protein
MYPQCADIVQFDRCRHLREKPVGYALNPNSRIATIDLAVADECGLVGAELGRDLLSFGVKVLAIGDRNQLPPINDDGSVAGYFTRGVPDFSLCEVHRQALDSPVIWLATEARLGRPLQLGDYGASSVVPSYRNHHGRSRP